jgi:alpha-ketoglutarate-dependent taurine dioxygenase
MFQAMRSDEIISGQQVLSEIETHGYLQLGPVEVKDPDSYLLSLISSFSEPVCFFRQPLIMRLRPRKGADLTSYAGTGRVDLHSDRSYVADPPRFISMMCITVGNSGGTPVISDAWKSLNDLDRETIEELQSASFSFKMAADSNRIGYSGPVISQSNERYNIRFRKDLITQKTNKAIEAFSEAVKKYAVRLSVSPGTIWILDNYRMLHGRTAIRGGLESNRFLKRVYSNDR